VNASELVEKVASRTGRERRDVRGVLEAAFDEIAAELVARQRVTLSGFGSFDVRRRAARLTRHPGTGEAIEVPDRDGIVFRAATKLRDALRESASGG
jgi:DNA-binding protein HU-beta